MSLKYSLSQTIILFTTDVRIISESDCRGETTSIWCSFHKVTNKENINLEKKVVLLNFWFQIFLLLYFLLYISSYLLIAKCYRKDRDFYCTVDEDEATVHKISIWLCTAVLAVSLGATLLLPVSIISNEILIIYPDSHYVQWLNSSLIQGKSWKMNKTFYIFYRLLINFDIRRSLESCIFIFQSITIRFFTICLFFHGIWRLRGQ